MWNSIQPTAFLILGGVFLYYGADWLIRGGVAIARRAGISMLVIGLTLVAFATSSPELVVSVQAAIDNKGDISLGNIIGSNICNIGLILGLSALLHPVEINRQILRFDWPVLFITSLIFAAIGIFAGHFHYISGIFFFICILWYTWYNIKKARKQIASGIDIESDAEEFSDSKQQPMKVLPATALVIIGGGILVLGGKLFVSGASAIARQLGVSEAIIALTVIALGTSLPELATSVLAAIRKESDIAVGNVIGSNIFNILCIMGIAPIIRSINATDIVTADWGIMICLPIILFPMMASAKKLSRLHGGILLTIYILYIAMLTLR